MTSKTHSFRLAFTNPGEIDIRGALIAGLSAKQGDSPIGKFGTGLKYAIACILRWGGQITVYSGTTPHFFRTSPIDFRGTEHHVIEHSANDGEWQPAGFTTHYGHQWEPWQVFRELYSNALDEHGEVWLGDEKLNPPAAGQTVILVKCDQLREPYDARASIVLPAGTSWLPSRYPTPRVQIAKGSSEYLYFKRVRVHATNTALTYNLSQADLTEDRTLTSVWRAYSAVAEAVQLLTDETAIWTFLNAAASEAICFEVNCRDRLCPFNTSSAEFQKVAIQLYKSNRRRFAFLKDLVAEWEPEAVVAAEVKLSKMQQLMLDKAKHLVSQMDVGDCSEVPIRVRNLEGTSILGTYNKALDEVTLSPEVFRQGLRPLVSTLFEEMTHRHTGMADCNYDMQTYLFNRIVELYAEHVFGEPI